MPNAKQPSQPKPEIAWGIRTPQGWLIMYSFRRLKRDAIAALTELYTEPWPVMRLRGYTVHKLHIREAK